METAKRPVLARMTTTTRVLAVALALSVPGVARARRVGPRDDGGGGEAPVVDPAAPSLTVPPIAAPPVSTPLPVPAAPVPTVAGVPVRITGTLHAMSVLSEGLQSFDNATFVAPTSALNPAVVTSPEAPRLTFQTQQTRFGLVIGEGSPFKGTAELDFTHFDQSSPTVQAYPRMRQALIEWTFAEHQKLFLGQTWDIFGNSTAPLLAHSFNLVGSMFRAGNIGFMRQQFGWSGRFGDLDVSAAIGLPAANATGSFNNVEEGSVPSVAARVMWLLGTHGSVGASVLGSELRFTKAGSPAEYRTAAGAELFADLTFDALNLHAEAYATQNLANMGALNLAFGRYGQDVRDVGAYVSAKYTAGAHAFTAMLGGAWVPDGSTVVPGYVAGASATPVTTNGTLSTTIGPGMEHNLSAHLGYWYSPLKGLSLIVEPYVYKSRFKLDASDVGRVDANRVAFGGFVGGLFQF